MNGLSSKACGFHKINFKLISFTEEMVFSTHSVIQYITMIRYLSATFWVGG